ncbi:hypothetical protein KVR01_004629 [Diaporthe batatas]|uniref:uncharacterized protein n=1 Tax=Diaporthe batatas TaxID=748121 RepID=UPI001D04642E|nr:uncharacterized protein KVR01_004629 [Diaporthe batatas]KAG8166077.1 hypothetical protein KVR01_004629 [Diaporthe batatas]
MQSTTPIPPPRLPPPRAALQDVTARANQSPVPLPPMGKAMGKTAPAVKPSAAAVPAPSAAPAPPASNSRKRKSDASSSSSEEAIAAYKQDLDHIQVDHMAVDRDCTYVRNMIQKVLDRGIFKKGEFCNTIGSSPNSVNRFLAQTGRDGGSGSDVYWNAWAWFKKRELAGLSVPAASATTQKKAKTAQARLSNANADLGSIHLDGEETDSVPVFETCDVVRRKITAHLKTPGLTQAQFCRDLHAQLHAPGCKSIQSKMLADFRKKKGPMAGCTSSVYYAAYVYFEKRRLAEGKPKSKHRLEMEAIYPGGAERERDPSHQRVWCHKDEVVSQDEYGRLSFTRVR